MRVGKPEDAVLIEIITAAGVPSYILLCLRSQLYHTLWHSRTWEGASTQGTRLICLGSDKRVYILCVVNGSQLHSCCHQNNQR